MSGFPDQLLSYLVTSSHCDTLLADAGANGFCTRSFMRRYGRDGYTIADAAIGPTTTGGFELPIYGVERLSGTRDRRGDVAERWALEFRRSVVQEAGWIDSTSSATVSVSFSALALTGAAVGNPVITEPPPRDYTLTFSLQTGDGRPETVDFPLDIYIFASQTIDAVADLRRIAAVRHITGADSRLLLSFDNAPEHRTSLFVQTYPANSDPSPLTRGALSALFEASDILLAFSSAAEVVPA